MRDLFFKVFASCSMILLADAAYAARVNVVHGIDGRDIGQARSLPVDVAVNNECLLKGVQFRQASIVELSPATYVFSVHLSDGKCSQPSVLSKNVTVEDGSQSISAVIALSQGGAPDIFVSNNSREMFLPSAVAVRHFAKAGPITVKFSSRELLKSQSVRLRNGKTALLSVLTDRLPFTINISSHGKLVARRTGVGTKRYTIFNVVGSRDKGFTVISESLVP